MTLSKCKIKKVDYKYQLKWSKWVGLMAQKRPTNAHRLNKIYRFPLQFLQFFQ